jgi:hypothetical protein
VSASSYPSLRVRVSAAGLISSLELRKLTCFPIASEKCHQEKRKTVNGEDILFAMTSLGFENYAEALKIYLAKYREASKPHLLRGTRLA